MWIRLLPAKWKSDSKEEEGFSLLEVLVTILVITGFVLGALQATVLATLFRVTARDRQEAANWIQQDLELIRFHAYSRLDMPTPSSGFTTSVNNTQACTNRQYGTRLRDYLIAQGFNNTDTVNIDNRIYSISRSYTPVNNTLRIEYRVEYATNHPRYSSSGNNLVSRLTTEVLPNAAINCQQQ